MISENFLMYPAPVTWTSRNSCMALAALLLAIPPVLPAQGGSSFPSSSTTEIDAIVALVDEDVILRSELDLAVAGIVERIQASGDSMPPQNLLETQVLERLILRELQVQKALQTGIRVSDADVDQALVALAQQNKMTVQQLRDVIEKDGEDFLSFAAISVKKSHRTAAPAHRQQHGADIGYGGGHRAGLARPERRRIQYCPYSDRSA
jgi:hypothetical protein